jgi:hypothetical protein
MLVRISLRTRHWFRHEEAAGEEPAAA